MEIDPELVVPDPDLSIIAGALAPWGELKEKIRGSSSGMPGPWSGHATVS